MKGSFRILASFLACCATLPATGQIVAPAAYYKAEGTAAEGTAADSSSNHNDGTTGLDVTYATGQLGQGFSFPGTNQTLGNNAVIIPDSAYLKPANLTVSAWVKFSSLTSYHFNAPTGEQIIIGKENTRAFADGWAFSYAIGKSADNRIFFAADFGQNDETVAYSTTQVEVNTWYHLVATYDHHFMKIYVNGGLPGTARETRDFVSAATPLILGRTNSSDWEALFSGVLDEVQVFDSAYFAGQDSGSLVSPPGLVSWWKGENNPNDTQGRSTATLVGGITFSAGMVGQAFNFDGSTARVETNLDVQPSAMPSTTWDAWVYPTTNNPSPSGDNSGRQTIFSDDDGGLDRNVTQENGGWGVFTGSGIWNPVDSNGNLVSADLNAWQHIAVVFTPTNIYFYKNGVQYTYGSPPTGGGTANTLTIGANKYNGGVEYFNGLIDEVDVFNRALAPAEIQAIYSNGVLGKYVAPPGDGMVSWWQGQGDATDFMGVNNGTLTNGATFDTGKVGQAFKLDASQDQYVSIPDSPSLRVKTLTIEGWVCFYSIPSSNPTYGSADADSYVLWYTNGALNGNVNDTVGSGPVISHPFSPSFNTTANHDPASDIWYHVAYTFDGHVHKLFFNGQEVESAANTTVIAYDSHPARIGADFSHEADAYPFDGKIDDVALYDHALTPVEIKAIYDAQATGKSQLPRVSVRDVNVQPNPSGVTNVVFNIDVAHPNASPITLAYTTLDGTATNPDNYTFDLNTVTIPANTYGGAVSVLIPAGSVAATKQFYLNVRNPTNAVLDRAYATGTLLSGGAVGDFFADTNTPSQLWQYGYTATDGTGFTNFEGNGSNTSITVWNKPGNDMGLLFNRTRQVYHYNIGTYQPTDELAMFPNPDGRKCVVRWKAPSAGTYQVSGLFQGIESAGGSTTSDATILKNGDAFNPLLFSTGVPTPNPIPPMQNPAVNFINGYGVQAPFSFSITVAAGDTLDFRVGWGSNYNYSYDGTGFKATITGGSGGSGGNALPAITTFSKTGPSTPGATIHFAATTQAGVNVRVQATTTPDNEGSWTDLTGGGAMTESPSGSYQLDTNGYPKVNGLYFRFISWQTGYTDGKSDNTALGPYDLRLPLPAITVGTLTGPSTPGGAITFTCTTDPGLHVRVQWSTDGTFAEGSWNDIADGNGGAMTENDPLNPGAGNYTLVTSAYPLVNGVYFRFISSETGYTDGKADHSLLGNASNLQPDVNTGSDTTVRALNTVTFAVPVNLGSGSYFPVRTVANITHPDPANANVDVIDPFDLDGDGRSDIVQADAGVGNKVTAYLRQADGSYNQVQFSVTDAPPGSISDLAVADVDNDGLPDIVVAAGGKIYVFANNGAQSPPLSFSAAATLTATDAHGTAESFVRVAVGDLNGDGLPDIVTSSTTVNSATTLPEGHVTVFLHDTGNNSNYKAGVVYVVPFGFPAAGAIAIGDVWGGDLVPDVIVADPTVLTGTQIAILPGKPDGTLVVNPSATSLPAQRIAQLPMTVTALALGDLDGDGHRDIFAAGSQWTNFNDGNGSQNALMFSYIRGLGTSLHTEGSWVVSSTPSSTAPSNTLFTDIAVGDFNLDGTLDVIIADSITKAVSIRNGYVNRNSSDVYQSTTFTPPQLFMSGVNVRSVSATLADSDFKIDLAVGSNDSTDTSVLINTSGLALSPLTGKTFEFASSTYTELLNTDIEVDIPVRRAPDSTGTVTVPFTVAGTALATGASSLYAIDPINGVTFNATTKKGSITFSPTDGDKNIHLSLSNQTGPLTDKTIIITLGTPTPTTLGKLGTLKATTITLKTSIPTTIHAANALTVKPGNIVSQTAAQLNTLGVKAVARTNFPWTFTASQTLDTTVPHLAMKVQFSPTPTGPWIDFPNNVMAPTKAGSTVWTVTSSDVFVCGKAYFRTLTSGDRYASQGGATVGAYQVVGGPRITLAGSQCPSTLATNPSNFTSAPMDTHNSESITYRFAFGNSGNGAATNVTIDIPLNSKMTHFGAAALPHLAGGTLVQIDSAGRTTTSNSSTAALRYQFASIAAGQSDTVDVVVDVISANEYNPKVQTASFGLQVNLPAYRITAAGENEQVYGTPKLSATIQSPLSIAIDKDIGVINVGGTITYTATLTNTAAVDYTQASFTAKVPSGASLENVCTNDGTGNFTGATISPTGGTNPAVAPYPFVFGLPQTLTWNLGTITAHSQLRVRFTVRSLWDLQTNYVDSTGVSNTTEIDLTNYNLSATPPTGGKVYAMVHDDDGPPLRTFVAGYDAELLPQLGLIKDAQGLGAAGGELTEDGLTVATVLPNDSIEYTLVYFNTGQSKARGCVIQEQIASGATFTGFLNFNGDTNPSPSFYVFKDGAGKLLPYAGHTLAQDLAKTKIIEFHIGDIAAGGYGFLKYRVAATTTAGKYIISQGYSMYSESLGVAQPGKPNQVPAKVVQPISFDIQTSADKVRVSPGELITYTIRFRNNGGIDATNLTVSCPVPLGTTFVNRSAMVSDENQRSVNNPAFPGSSITLPTTANANTISFSIPTLVPDESFTDVNGNGFHEADEPFTDGSNHNGIHDGEGIAMFTVQVQNPLPLSLRVPSSVLQNKATITGHYPQGALVQSLEPTQPGQTTQGSSLRTGVTQPPLLAAPPVTAASVVLIKMPDRTNLWAMKTAPQFVTKGQRMMYKVVFGNNGNIAVNNVQCAIQVPYGTTLDKSYTTAGYSLVGGIATWNRGNLATHGVDGVNLCVIVSTSSSYKNDTLEENSCYVKSIDVGALKANAQEIVPGPSRTTVLSTNPVVSAWQSFCCWLGSLGGNTHGPVASNEVHSLNDGTIQTTIRGVDIIALKNGAIIIQNGGGQIVAAGAGNVVAQGAGNVVAQGAGNVVAQGAGNVVAAGAGNVISVSTVGFLTQDSISNIISGIVSAGAGNVVAQGAGNIVATGGGNLIGDDGETLIDINGSPIVATGGGNLKLTPQLAGVVAAGAGNIVATGAGNIVAAGAGNLVSTNGGNVVAAGAGNLLSNKAGYAIVVNPNGAGVVAAGAGNVVAQGAGNVVAQGAGNVVAQGAGN